MQLSLLHIQQVNISHRFEQTGNDWWYVAEVRPTRCYSIPADWEQTQWRATARLALVAERYVAGAECWKLKQCDMVRCTRVRIETSESMNTPNRSWTMDNRKTTDRQTSSWKQVLTATEDNGASVLTRALVKISCSSQHQLNFWSNCRQLQVIQQTTQRQFLFTHAIRQYVINSLHLLNFVNGMLFNDYY